MKTLTLAVILIIFNLINLTNLLAQVTEEWVQRFNGTGNNIDEARAVEVDGSGNVYVTGISRGTATGDDYTTIKYNSSGVQQWVRTYNGPGNLNDAPISMTIDNSGNVYVTGKSYGNDYDYATVKYNSAGDQLWAARYSFSGFRVDEAKDIKVDESGNVYVTGFSYAPFAEADYATVKYNSSGVQQWAQRYGFGSGSLDMPSSIDVDGSGNVYVTGSSNGFTSGNDFATIKYNSAGTQQWLKRFTGSGNFSDAANYISTDDAGNVYVTGYITGSTGSDYATVKYNSAGTEQWVRTYNGPGDLTDAARILSLDESGNIYVTGLSHGGAATSYDCATIKYDPSGNQLWLKRFNGTSSVDDEANSMYLDNSENVYVTGVTQGNYLAVKYNSSGDQQWVYSYNGPGNAGDAAASIISDESGNIYLTGKSFGDGTNDDFATIKLTQSSLPLLTLNFKGLIEGFYDSGTNTMIGDNVKIYLRSITSPYNAVEFSETGLNSSGEGTFDFNDAVNGTPYYIVVNHRNAIETWSTSGEMFSSNSLNYDFTTAANKAFGDNQIQKGTKFCFYSGDPNQDGSVDGTDLSLIDNDASNFITGYVTTDLDGNDFVDASDAAIADNNAANFVSKITP